MDHAITTINYLTLSIIPKQYQNMYTHDLILVQIFLASTKKRHQTPGAHMERQKSTNGMFS